MNIVKFLFLCILCVILFSHIYQGQNKEPDKKPQPPIPIVVPIIIPEPNIPKPLPVVIVPDVPVYAHILYDDYIKSLELGKYFKKKTIIVFSADWCGYCKKLKENIDQLDPSNDYVICILNVDLQDNKYLLAKYKIKGLPTSIILDTTLVEPNEISRKTGFNKSDYIQWVKQISITHKIKNETPTSKTTIESILDDRLEAIEFISVSEYRCLTPDSIYSDVLSHSRQEPHGDKAGRYTNVHETAHGIHNELRNEYKLLLKAQVNVFYCLNGKAVILKEPNIKIRHISKYIPSILRSSRYKLYLVDQVQYWDDVPLYILDEWNCYILGGECAVDDFNNKRPLEKTNAISGCLEFSIYSVALCMAIKEHDPEYWATNAQFKAFIRYNLIRSERTFGAGTCVQEFNNDEQNRLYDSLLNHEDSKPIRVFLKNEFDGIFVD